MTHVQPYCSEYSDCRHAQKQVWGCLSVQIHPEIEETVRYYPVDLYHVVPRSECDQPNEDFVVDIQNEEERIDVEFYDYPINLRLI